MSTFQRERLSIRIPAETKRRIEKAAGISRQSLTDFFRSTLDEALAGLLEQHQAITLSSEAFDEFIAALDIVEAPNEVMRNAVARFPENPL